MSCMYYLRNRICGGLRRSPRIQDQQTQTQIRAVKNISYIPRGDEGYLYLIREREFCRMQEHVYKIGRSWNFEQRFKNYPKDSEVIHVGLVKNQLTSERGLIHTFDKRFNQRSDIGREYYEGDQKEMKKCFLEFLIQLE